MSRSTFSGDQTQIDVNFPDDEQRNTYDDDGEDEEEEPNVPLLHQQSVGQIIRSKPILTNDLGSFRVSLKWCALDHSSCSGKLVSYVTFILLTIIVPILSCVSVNEIPSSSEKPTVSFNVLAQFPESGLASIGFLTLLCFFKRFGLRQLLFLDGALEEDSVSVKRGYTRELEKAFRYHLAYILLPSFFVELAHKIIFFSTVRISLPVIDNGVDDYYHGASSSTTNLVFPLNSIMFVLVLVSWVYRTGLFLLVCVLFRLTCELQILRFGGLVKMFSDGRFGSGSDFENVGAIFREHVRIKKHLKATSHRYRFFIIASLVVITVSQFAALLLLLASKSDKSFLNSGDLVVCSAVQLSGFFLCLLGAARITHRAQAMASVATKWHMSVTCPSTGSIQGAKPTQELDGTVQLASKCSINSGGVDSSSDNNILITVSSNDHNSFFQTRQALVAYFQHNGGGITLYGYALDRGLLHTLFGFEFSLVMWILSKVVVLSQG